MATTLSTPRARAGFCEFAVLTQDGNLRGAFVQVDAHVYHRLGLLSQSGLATCSEVPAYFRLDGRPTCLWHHYGLDARSSLYEPLLASLAFERHHQFPLTSERTC